MKTWLKENWFKLMLIFVLIWFLAILKTYLRDKNQIEAKTNRAECMHWAMSSGAVNVCADIETYKIKSEFW